MCTARYAVGQAVTSHSTSGVLYFYTWRVLLLPTSTPGQPGDPALDWDPGPGPDFEAGGGRLWTWIIVSGDGGGHGCVRTVVVVSAVVASNV